MIGVADEPADVDGRVPPRERGARSDPALPGGGVLAIAVVGLALGLAATAIVLGRGWDPGAVAVGPWVTHPRIGTPSIDPYARAELARSGAVPMASSEGLSFAATTDDTGYRLVSTCTYRLSGAVPPARFWTLTATDRAGLTLGGDAGRSAFTSTTVIRDASGGFVIEAGPEARPGNWMALSGDGPLTLTLRLYDTPLTGDTGEIASAALPGITRESCGGPG
ncbi:DUF1214 domain-containing protein [Lichenibacterium minor]|uniref:DUF1214 domain-containing protein n=1 Tax=Lichenibacterium minor TaxID=2316528 RepID=A0A4Q2U731_9HYPH|nr:DUF1214 domain-containing protein [Lichenibacterium minor]RYC31698.1 DUF1214 domain-containing protein [Lichenibacterium minor]